MMEAISGTNISPVDALWALYQAQSKRVRRAFYSRLLAEEQKRKEEEEMRVYESTLPKEVQTSVRAMALSIKKGVEDVCEAKANNTRVGRNAEDFLAELEQDL